MGMTVVVAARKDNSTSSAALDTDRVPFQTLLSQVTVLLLSLPLTPTTKNLISAAELALLPECAIIVNVSRGGIVDEPAVMAALRQRQIFGYGTDVLAKEPAGSSDDSVLLAPDIDMHGGKLNLVVTPHVGWFGSSTMLATERLTARHVRECADKSNAGEGVVLPRDWARDHLP
jgi:glycerate dehydrogenase